MKVLFLCNTLYQLIVSACIREMYSDAETELILSDHTVSTISIYDKLKNKKTIFNRVYYINSKQYFDTDQYLSRTERYEILRHDKDVIENINLGETYDMFFCANSEPFSIRIVNYLKHRNKKTIINWFEDGLSAYDYDKKYFPSHIGSRFRCRIKKMMGIYDVVSSVRNYYVFQPQKMEWKPKASVKQICPMSKEMALKLGNLFEFSECVDKYTEKYIFFEDGAMDWNTSSDIELVKVIAEIVGKNNIFIKIHPRNPINRFKELGFKTSNDLSIPWEIIAANIDIDRKVLITMYSQSVVTSDILLGKNGHVIALGEIEGYSDKTGKTVFSYIERQYLAQTPSKYYIPYTVDELKEILYKEMKID